MLLDQERLAFIEEKVGQGYEVEPFDLNAITLDGLHTFGLALEWTRFRGKKSMLEIAPLTVDCNSMVEVALFEARNEVSLLETNRKATPQFSVRRFTLGDLNLITDTDQRESLAKLLEDGRWIVV